LKLIKATAENQMIKQTDLVFGGEKIRATSLKRYPHPSKKLFPAVFW
jgi:hypothetical protein